MKTAEKYTRKNEGPYRIQFPVWVRTEEGLEIEIRPFKPEDVDEFKLLFETLSPESIYFRFFSPLKSPPADMLKQFCSLDETCEIVLAALDRAEAMLGIACVIILEDRIRGEFAVLVGDPWQGKGIGAELLKHCLLEAKRRGVETVWGDVMVGNTKMLALGKRLGFARKRMPYANEYQLCIDLNRLDASALGHSQ